MIHVSQSIMLYPFYAALCQLYFKKTGEKEREKRERRNKLPIAGMKEDVSLEAQQIWKKQKAILHSILHIQMQQIGNGWITPNP